MCAVDADNTEGRGDGASAGVAAVGMGRARTAEGTIVVTSAVCAACRHSSVSCLSIDTVMLIVPTWLVGNKVLYAPYSCTDVLIVQLYPAVSLYGLCRLRSGGSCDSRSADRDRVTAQRTWVTSTDRWGIQKVEW